MQTIINSLSPEQIQTILSVYNTLEAWLVATVHAAQDCVINEDIII